ncbi:MAG: NAD(P)/FAD-dependent oxidoreductase [Chloroflexi bacterium]|nr:NAD(P)/FAD-dependent oxidoreductase [Chloroflexota bacterium]
MEKKNIAVVGAGFGGLSAAYDLAKAGHTVTIFENESTPGGLAGGFKEPGWDWSVEKFYHHWFTSDRHMFELFRELGLESKVLIRSPKTVMFFNDKFYPFDSYSSALLYPGLGFGFNKIRFGLVGIFLRLTKKWQPLEKATVEEWMRKWAGERVYDQMWQPMVVGKFGEHFARLVNMAWMWARLHARSTKLATYQGGFQSFADDFSAILQKMEVRIRFNTKVEKILIGEENRVDLVTSAGVEQFDQVLVTLSPAQMAKMTPQLPDEYLKGLLDLKNLGAVVLTISIKQPLSREGYYWYNLPKSAGFPFLALVEHTNFLPKEHFGGENLIYCGDYLENDHEYFKLTKEELLAKFLPSFKRINPEFNPNWVNRSWLTKADFAQPVPMVNHSKNIPAIATPISGVFFASMSQVYPWDRGTNFAVEIARKAVGLMIDEMKSM